MMKQYGSVLSRIEEAYGELKATQANLFREDLLFRIAASPHASPHSISLSCHPEERSDVGICCSPSVSHDPPSAKRAANSS